MSAFRVEGWFLGSTVWSGLELAIKASLGVLEG